MQIAEKARVGDDRLASSVSVFCNRKLSVHILTALFFTQGLFDPRIESVS